MERIKIEKVPLFKVCIPNTDFDTTLRELGFEQNGGDMEIYQEFYVDIPKIEEAIENMWDNFTYPEEAKRIVAVLEDIAEVNEAEDGTICFYHS